MAERRLPPSTAALEQALRRLGTEIAYPPTPPLAARVRARLEDEPRPPRLWLSPRRLLALAALLLALLLGLLLASPGARTVVADRLGLRGVDMTHLPFVPWPTPTTTPVPLGVGLGLGRLATADEAAGAVSFAILQPTLPELGVPEVYVADTPPGGRVALVYRGPPTILLVEFRGAVDPAFLGKGLGPNTRLEQMTVESGRGFWIDGDPHVVLFRAPDGQVRDDQIRLAGNVLLWEHGELTLRIEGAPSKEAALRIASSMR